MANQPKVARKTFLATMAATFAAQKDGSAAAISSAITRPRTRGVDTPVLTLQTRTVQTPAPAPMVSVLLDQRTESG